MTPPEYIQTFSGKRVRLTAPDPNSISLGDIARALGRLCRFGGHSRIHYSVAEHSINVMRYVRDELGETTEHQRAALLHDAAETYLGDVVKPLKVLLGDVYRELERGFEAAIAERFGVDFAASREYVREGDLRCLMSEAGSLLPGGPKRGEGGHWPLVQGWSGCDVIGWDSAIASARFESAARRLGL